MQPSVFSTQGAGAARSATGGSFPRTQSAPVNNGAESDSWIEVASHPSDSQYTSSSDDHIITAGLRISQTRRRRRGTARPTARPQEVPVFKNEQSSGEEEDDDDESEGEDMGTMIHSMTMSSDDYSSPDDDDESDDEASASDSNIKPRATFPPSVPVQRPGAPYRRAQTTPSASTVYDAQNRNHAHGFNSFAPNHAADHDAALRASLSTLLSCAAAARGLPKSGQTVQAGQSPQQGGRVTVDSLTLVREGGEPNSPTTKPRSLSITSTSTASTSRSPSSQSPAMNDSKKLKRKSSKSKRRSRSRARDTSHENEAMSLSNFSYMTLAISAGAIIVLSAITFSAGYALGKEVGKGEGGLLSSVGSVSRREGGKAALKTTSRGIGMTKFTSVAAF